MKEKVLASVITCLFVFCIVSVSLAQDKPEKKPWDVPEKYMSMKNPHADDASLLRLGKMMYSKHCKSCHGNFGKGDGPKAKSIKADLGDFTSAEFKAQKDGVIYYQSFVGRDEMPNFEKKILDDEERWAIVNYIRTLKK